MRLASRTPGQLPLVSVLLLVGVTPVVSTGCRPPTASVTGSVRLNGRPLDEGVVVFHATDGKYRETQGAEVTGGLYHIGGLPTKPMDVETTRTNDTTPLGPRLRVELKPGPQVFDIELMTPPAKK